MCVKERHPLVRLRDGSGNEQNEIIWGTEYKFRIIIIQKFLDWFYHGAPFSERIENNKSFHSRETSFSSESIHTEAVWLLHILKIFLVLTQDEKSYNKSCSSVKFID